MKKYLFILSFLILFFPKKVFATEKINKFGIHILEPQDLPYAEKLVNSSGGNWGWVTIVIRDNDLNFQKWQEFMNECRERHLIPIIRIATHLENSVWVKPKKEDAKKWFNFLNSLNWPTKNQYVIVFNEPNHAKEWGGEINPQEYSQILTQFIQEFKKEPKFKILNAGLDLAAGNTRETMDSLLFMEKMYEENPKIFELLDGWASHSYPNHGYVGKPWGTGKHSIKGYEWELNILKSKFHIDKNLSIFITETGWPKEEIQYKFIKKGSKTYKIQSPSQYYDPKTVANYIKFAFENIWLKDERVVAVTPFVLNYPGELFFKFSWLDKNKNPYPQYEEIQKIPKIFWWPEQENKIEVISFIVPSFIPTNSTYKGKIYLKNSGQSILGEKMFEIKSISDSQIQLNNLLIKEGKKIYPNENFELEFEVYVASFPGTFKIGWENLVEKEIKVLQPSIVTNTKYTLWELLKLKIKETLFSKR